MMSRSRRLNGEQIEFPCVMTNWMQVREVAASTDRTIQATYLAMIRLGLKRWVPARHVRTMGIMALGKHKARQEGIWIPRDTLDQIKVLTDRENMTRHLAINMLIELGLVSRKPDNWKKEE